MISRSGPFAVTCVLAFVAVACSGGGEGRGTLSSSGGHVGAGGGPGGGVTGSGGAPPGNSGSGGVGSPGSGGGMAGGRIGSAGAPGRGGAAGAGGAPADCTPLAPITRRLLALQPVQYGNATRDLLALAAAPDVVGVDDTSVPATDFVINQGHLYAYYVAAGEIAKQVPARVASLANCTASEQEVDCASRFARTFGRLAFRRALDDDEVTDAMKVFAAVCPGPAMNCASEADFGAAIALMVKAFILAPSFLYRTELGPRNLTANAAGAYPDTTMTGDEIATQLAFVFLDSTPDADLRAAADSGALAAPAGILTQVDRLLTVPVAQSHLVDLISRWLKVDRLSDRTKDAGLLAALPAAEQAPATIAADLRTSWDRSVSETLWSNPPGKIEDLLTSRTFFADRRLATLYGLPSAAPDATFAALAWPAGQPRAGVLTHPAFLWANSEPINVSPVQRGKAIHTQFVCEDPTQPEPELDSAAARAVIAAGDSEATRSDARLASGTLCADSCHSELDPYGRMLHAFDAIGNYRTVDEAGRPIETTVSLTASSPLGAMAVAGPVAFAQALIASKVFTGCAVQRLLEATVAVPVTVRNSCQVNALRAAFDQSDGTMGSLMRALATADLAHARAGGRE